jgi:hypothetical protein
VFPVSLSAQQFASTPQVVFQLFGRRSCEKATLPEEEKEFKH